MTRYFILFCLAGIIEMIFMGLGMGMSIFSMLSAMTIILFSFIFLGKRFVNGRIIRLALGFSLMHLVLGNMPIALASESERMMPVSAQFGISVPRFVGAMFKGPLDHFIFFWIAQSVIFTLAFLGVFVIFSLILRRIDHAVHSRAVQNQSR